MLRGRCVFEQATADPLSLSVFSQVLFHTRPADGAAALGITPSSSASASLSAARIRVRLTGLPPSAALPLRDLRAAAVGRLVSVSGVVVRATGVRPLVTSLDFECGKCGSSTRIPFAAEGGYRCVLPKTCLVPGCRGKAPAPIPGSAATIDAQRARLQDLPVGAAAGGGSTSTTAPRAASAMPAGVDVDLTEDLVGCAPPGALVTVVGFVRVIPVGGDGGGGGGGGGSGGGASSKAGAAAGLAVLYLDALSVVPASPSSATASTPASGRPAPSDIVALPPPGHDAPPHAAAFSLRDLAFVATFAREVGGSQFRHLVHALAPGIYGHDMVKAALVLGMFGAGHGGGGGEEGTGDHGSAAAPARGGIHVLLCGDPGLGKSQLLAAAAAASPRGLYVCGSGGSAAGLTAAVGRDPITGAPALEAGALPLAHLGVCCLDEFDKLGADHGALEGVLESEEVTVAKAGVVATLPARTAVLAAANPAGGRYDSKKSIAANVRLSPALLSRFDLVFLMADEPDAGRDAALAEHVLAVRSGRPERAAASRAALAAAANKARSGLGGLLTQGPHATPPPTTTPRAGGGLPPRTRPSLAAQLAARSPSDADPVPASLISRYIAYARSYCRPTLSPGARAVVRAAYLALRDGAPPSGADGGDDNDGAAAIDAWMVGGDGGGGGGGGGGHAGSGVSATARHLDALVRLTAARARADLRSIATADDARDAAELMARSVLGGALAGCDWAGGVGGRGVGGAPGKRRGGTAAELARLLAAATSHARARGSALFTTGELCALADELDLDVPDVPAALDAMNDRGDLLKKGPGMYEVVAAARAVRAAAAAAAAAGPPRAWGGAGENEDEEDENRAPCGGGGGGDGFGLGGF